MAKRLDFSESNSLHSHRHPADKWDGRSRPSLPLRESILLGHSTQTRWFAEFGDYCPHRPGATRH
jgi:hypothetical protein